MSADDIAVYKGDFIEDKFDGQAEVLYGNGDKYTGPYKHEFQVISYHIQTDRHPLPPSPPPPSPSPSSPPPPHPHTLYGSVLLQ